MNRRTHILVPTLALLCAALAAGRDGAAPSARSTLAESAPVHGVVRDTRAHEPLAAYALDVRGGVAEERVTTDASGRFTTTIPFEAGPITILPVDHAATSRGPRVGGLALPAPALAPIERTWDPSSGGVDVEVDVGPKFELAFSPAESTTPDAPRAPEGLDGARAFLEARGADAIDEGPVLSTVVRASPAAPWLRFAPLPALFAAPNRARLVVVSRDGLWRAEADVTSELERPLHPIALAWRGCARWSGRIRDNHSQPVPGVWLSMTRLGANGQALERRRTRADGQGGYAFEALAPGDWQLAGQPLRFREFASMPRTLAALVDSKLGINLEKTPLAGDLKGRIEGPAASAARPLEALVVLRRGGEILPIETVTALWRIDGARWIGEFAFPSLPGGEYDLELLAPPGDAGFFANRTLTARVPSTSIVFQRKPG